MPAIILLPVARLFSIAARPPTSLIAVQPVTNDDESPTRKMAFHKTINIADPRQFQLTVTTSPSSRRTESPAPKRRG